MLKSVVLGLALSSFAWLGAAEASIVTVSYSGLLTEGADANQVFGAGTNLANLPVLVTYVFDTSKGTPYFAAGESSVIGGSLNGASTPALSATVTVNNISFSFAGDATGIIAASDDLGSSHLGQTVLASNGDSAYSMLDAAVGTFANSITAPLSLDAKNDTFTGQTFFSLANGASGDFLAQTVSVSSVPLPASLPLFAAALCGLGLAAAIRKQSTSSAR